LEALRAFLFGITVAAPIGPIAVLLVRTGLNHRYSAALAGALGVALADFTYALIALSAGSGLAVVLQTHQREIQLAASALLIALGLYLAAGALRKVDPLAGSDDAASQAPGLLEHPAEAFAYFRHAGVPKFGAATLSDSVMTEDAVVAPTSAVRGQVVMPLII